MDHQRHRVAVLKDKNFRYVFRPTVHSDQYGEGSVSLIHEHAQAKLRTSRRQGEARRDPTVSSGFTLSGDIPESACACSWISETEPSPYWSEWTVGRNT